MRKPDPFQPDDHLGAQSDYWPIGMLMIIPPITSFNLKSFFGLLGCALWHPMQAWEMALSA